VDAKREQLLIGAKKKARKLSRTAKEKKHQKNIKTKTWKAFAEEWQEAMWMAFGKDVHLASWGAKEKNLARLLLKEVGYDTAVKMVRHFIEGWDEPGLPAFNFLWTRRESVLATVKGQAKTRRGRIDIDEYDEARDGNQPKVGWG
jgi:hypothetical protein